MTEHDIIVLGAGSYGTTVACLFSKQYNVGLYGRPEIIRKFKENGIKLEGSRADYFTENQRLRFYSDPEELSNVQLANNGTIILATKTPDLERIIQDSFKYIYHKEKKQNLLMIQNGVSPELRIVDLLKRDYPKMVDRLVGGVVMGRIAITDFETPKIDYYLNKTSIGAWSDYDDNKTKRNVVAECVKLFLSIGNVGGGGVDLATSEEEYKESRVLKAMQNGANSLTTLVNAPVGMLIDNPFLRYLMVEKLQETINIANAEGFNFDAEETRKTTYNIYDTVVRNHKPSMCQDLELVLKRPEKRLNTEIIDLDLDFVSKGKNLNLPTRINSLCGHIIQEWGEIINHFKNQGKHDTAVKFSEDFIMKNRNAINFYSKEWHPSVVETPLKIYENFQRLKSEYLGDKAKELSSKIDYNPGNHKKKTIRMLFVNGSIDCARNTKDLIQKCSEQDSEFMKYYVIIGDIAQNGESVVRLITNNNGNNNFDLILSDSNITNLYGLENGTEKIKDTPLLIHPFSLENNTEKTQDFWKNVKIKGIYKNEKNKFQVRML